jgi:hypothetical protein
MTNIAVWQSGNPALNPHLQKLWIVLVDKFHYLDALVSKFARVH